MGLFTLTLMYILVTSDKQYIVALVHSSPTSKVDGCYRTGAEAIKRAKALAEKKDCYISGNILRDAPAQFKASKAASPAASAQ